MTETVLTVDKNESIARGIYRMRLLFTEKAPLIKCGQFLMLSLGTGEAPLRRPFGIAAFDSESVTVCYQVAGQGTARMAKMSEGTSLPATLPLGNGFDLQGAERIALIGGGAGIFPLLSVASQYPDKKYFARLGFRSADFVCLKSEFSQKSDLKILTDDGTEGEKGNAVEALIKLLGEQKIDLVLACGPLPMLRALKAVLAGRRVKCQVSLEERMGCGIGACLVCTCKTVKDGTEKRQRICRDGPVFDIKEVEL